MIGGQVVDVELEGQPLDKPVLDFIHEMKTSALIECSMMIGAVLAGADEVSSEYKWSRWRKILVSVSRSRTIYWM